MPDSQYKYYSIAIIGGGFSGLTLANYLSKHCRCQVLEAKEEPIPIVGTIRLPLARKVLQELDIFDSSIFVNYHDDTVDRQSFLNLLRGKIMIHYSCRIVRIDHRMENKQYWLLDDQDQRHGPFDCVVATNGLCFGPSVSAQASAVLGDARWQYDTWFWDFGRCRIQRGGNIALSDARELGTTLLGNDRVHIPTKFQPKSLHHRWYASKLMLMGAVVAILVRIFQNLEKI